MEKRAFGKTDMNVSVLGLGGHELNTTTVDEASRILHQALESGINAFDTAECYGQSEETIGRAIGHRRSEYYLFTKCGHAAGLDLPDWHPRMLEQSIERSLQRLRTDHLDLVQLHSCSEKLLRAGEVIEVLQRARDAGKTHYIGYSGDRRAALYAVRCGVFDALQISVNIADQEAIDTIIPVAQDRQMGVIAKRPLACAAWKMKQKPVDPSQAAYWQRLAVLDYDFLKGNLDAAASIALHFTLNVPGVNVAIVGTTNPERIRQNCLLLETTSLPVEQRESIRARWRAVTWKRKWIPSGRWGWHGWV